MLLYQIHIYCTTSCRGIEGFHKGFNSFASLFHYNMYENFHQVYQIKGNQVSESTWKIKFCCKHYLSLGLNYSIDSIQRTVLWNVLSLLSLLFSSDFKKSLLKIPYINPWKAKYTVRLIESTEYWALIERGKAFFFCINK